MFTRFTALLLVLLAALALAGCGSDDSSSDDSGSSDTKTTETTDSGSDSEGGGTTLELGVVGSELKFDETKLEAPAGKVTLKLTNDSGIPHNIVVEGFEDDGGELVSGGEVSETTVELEPGTYTYYCTPHKSSGMTGTLTVT